MPLLRLFPVVDTDVVVEVEDSVPGELDDGTICMRFAIRGPNDVFCFVSPWHKTITQTQRRNARTCMMMMWQFEKISFLDYAPRKNVHGLVVV
jgi:hypothetical protein